MYPTRPRPSAAALGLIVAMLAPAVGLAQNDTLPMAAKTEAECRSYAAQKANEEYMSAVRLNRETSPFARSPSGRPDPLQQSANQQASIDKAGREQQIYNDCVARLPK